MGYYAAGLERLQGFPNRLKLLVLGRIHEDGRPFSYNVLIDFA